MAQQAVVRKWYEELWDGWKVEVADSLFTDDYQLHIPGQHTFDKQAVKPVVQMFQQAFPDLKHIVHETIGVDGSVAARWTVRGTHRGEFQGIPASGKSIDVSGITIHHIRDERISETWLAFDTMTLVRQIS
jgi:steroid delta-isomerase-like uncharacterized protein